MALSFTQVICIVADTALIFINNERFQIPRNHIFKTKVTLRRFVDLKMTFSLMLGRHSLYILLSLFLSWIDEIPRNGSTTIISFFSDDIFSVLRWVKSLLRNLQTHLSIKNNGNEFFRHITLSFSISWWNDMKDDDILYALYNKV